MENNSKIFRKHRVNNGTKMLSVLKGGMIVLSPQLLQSAMRTERMKNKYNNFSTERDF